MVITLGKKHVVGGGWLEIQDYQKKDVRGVKAEIIFPWGLGTNIELTETLWF